MRRLILIICGAGIVGLAGAAAADGLTGSATLGASDTGGGSNNAKYREYWYDMHVPGALSPAGSFSWDGNVSGFDMFADGSLDGRTGIAGQSTDGGVTLEGGAYGVFRVRGNYTRIGHNFAFGARSMYTGIGSGDLHLADPAMGSAAGLSASPYRASVLQSYVDNEAMAVDIGLIRDRVNVGIDLASLEPFTASLNVNGERRRGTRPLGFSMGGFSNVVEIPEPIDYETMNLSTNLGYADRIGVFGGVPLAANLTAAHSNFQNNIEALRVDNPLGSLLLSNTYTAATVQPSYGQSALAPSNHADSVAGSLTAKLPYHLRLSGHGSLALMSQDETLLPTTVNPYLAPGAPSRTQADARVLNTFAMAALTADPVERAPLTITYRYRSHDNQTPTFYNLTPVYYDQSIGASSTSIAVSTIERAVELEQAFEVSAKVRLTTGVEHEYEALVNGSALSMNENRFKLALDTQALDWASLRVSGEHAIRVSNYDTPTVAEDNELPWSEKYYNASRDQDLVTVMTTLQAGDEFTVGVEYTGAFDTYPDSVFGLTSGTQNAGTIDLTYAPAEGVAMSSYYTVESIRTHQSSRQWNPGRTGVGDPYFNQPGIDSPSNWDLDSVTLINTVGTNADYQIVPERLSLHLGGAASVTRGSLLYASLNSATVMEPPTAATTVGPDTNPFTPENVLNSDSTQSINLGVSLTYRITKKIRATAAYRYDFWNYRDDLLNGFTEAATTAYFGYPVYNNLLAMGTPFKSYEVHSVYAEIGVTF